MKSLYILVVFLFVIQGVFSSEYYVSVKQQEDKILVTHFISSDSLQEYTLILPESYSQINSNLNYTLSDNLVKINGDKILFSYLQENIDSSNSRLYFLINLKASDFSRISVDLFSEKGYSFDENLMTPGGWGLISDGSSTIASLYSLSSDKILVVLVKKDKKDFSWIFFLFGFFFFFLLIYYIFFKKKKSQNFLLEDESKIIEFLRKSDRHESWQKKIQTEFNFSKAKLSRLLRNLESRGMLEKIAIGNTNKIKLK